MELGEDWLYFVLIIFSLSLRGEMSDPSVCLSPTIDNWVDKLTGYTFRSMALQPLRGVATVGTFRIILLIAVTRFQTRHFLSFLWTFFYFFLLLFNEYMQVQCRFIKYIDRPCDYCQNGQMAMVVVVEKKKLEWFASDTAWQQSSLYWSVRAWEEKLVEHFIR